MLPILGPENSLADLRCTAERFSIGVVWREAAPTGNPEPTFIGDGTPVEENQFKAPLYKVLILKLGADDFPWLARLRMSLLLRLLREKKLHLRSPTIAN